MNTETIQITNKSIEYTISPTREFTSGNLFEKLEKAFEAQQLDLSFQNEVSILQDSLPPNIPISQISIKPGATWIPIKYYEKFCKEVFNVVCNFFYSPTIHEWDVQIEQDSFENGESGWAYDPVANKGQRYYRVTEYPAVGEKMSKGLFTLAINQQIPTVKITKNKGDKPEEDTNLTRLAIAKQNQLIRKFSAWCREDSDRAEKLEEIYNRKINRSTIYNWTGSGKHLREYLKATRINPEWCDRLRNYQLDAIWRFSQKPGIIALEVGLGKTAVACCAIMLRKHYRTINKAAVVVQRSTLKQFYQSFKELYPGANILCPLDSDDINQANRQKFLAKARYFNWDVVLISHEQFKMIPVKSQTEIEETQSFLNIIEQEIYQLHKQGQSDKRQGKQKGNAVLKQLYKIEEKTRSRLSELADIRDTGLCWEDLGFDFLLVDEIQCYKNNYISTKLSRQIGISVSPSGRAIDFDLKAYWLRKNYGNNCIVGMTGTPEPTNSLLGVYVFQSYFQPQELEKRGIAHFDSWVSVFGHITNRPEPKIDGKWRMTERLTDFVNVPELANLYFEMVHFKRYKDVIDDFHTDDRRPKTIYHDIYNEMSEFQIDKMKEVAERYQDIKNQTPKIFPYRNKDNYLINKKGDVILHPSTKRPMLDFAEAIALDLDPDFKTDNFLSLFTEAKYLVIAPQLLDPEIPVTKTDKIYRVAKKVFELYKKHEENRLTQVIFCDIGTPGGNAKFPIYEWLKNKLVEFGVKTEEIAFIQDYPSNDDRRHLFDLFNSGKIRILIASTQAGGIGVNIQCSLHAVHHLTVPDRPDNVEQREGRAVRIGNKNDAVEIYRYITKGMNGKHGANTVQLEFLERKQKSRDKFFNGDPTQRTFSDGDSASQLFAMLKAESTGDERIIRYIELEVLVDEKQAEVDLLTSELAKLKSKRAGSIYFYEKEIENHKKNLLKHKIDRETLEENNILDFDFEEDIQAIAFSFIKPNHTFVGCTGFLPRNIFSKKSKIFNPIFQMAIAIYAPCLSVIIDYSKAVKIIGSWIVTEVEATNYHRSGLTDFDGTKIYEIGKFKGFTVRSLAYGNDQYDIWLQGKNHWKMIFRKTDILMIDQLFKTIETIRSSSSVNDRYLTDFQNKLDKAIAKKEILEAELPTRTKEVNELEHEKIILQSQLDIVE